MSFESDYKNSESNPLSIDNFREAKEQLKNHDRDDFAVQPLDILPAPKHKGEEITSPATGITYRAVGCCGNLSWEPVVYGQSTQRP